MPQTEGKGRNLLTRCFASMTKTARRIVMISLCAVLLFVAGVSATFAYEKINGGTSEVNSFTPAAVTCEVTCTQNGADYSYTVTNKGNVDAYIRMKYVIHWVSTDGTTVHWKQPDMSYRLNSSDPWKHTSNTDSTYYYSLRVKPGETTSGTIVITDPSASDTPPAGYKFSVTVVAEAIQADGATAQSGGKLAIQDAWGDFITVNADGSLTIN